ncbi:uncharacterized protein LOC101460932 isoform X2 [Ceratitis capitata]|uniref:uncharacterized protein LOC101460932 isoform X2 n=1 Tax=Ceratitis capitata TaxID=7213 RepID=UPI00061881FA|nr:uncharacterized protein LOC101460932 isoform X2 [Ceratitis capitata]
MNEKLSLPAATPIEQQQLQQQQHQQQHKLLTNTCATIDHTDYHGFQKGGTSPPTTAAAVATTTTTTTVYKYESNNSNNVNASEIDVSYGETAAASEYCAASGGGTGGASIVAGSELYRYVSVASLDGVVAGTGTKMLASIDAYVAPAPTTTSTSTTATAKSIGAPTILKISHTPGNLSIVGSGSGSGNGSKGSNMNSPHKQQSVGPQRDNFCGCFGGSGGGGAADAKAGVRCELDSGDKQQLPALTFWPALFANLGICTLLLGYLLVGSFLFLTIETSGDGGSAAGVVSDPNAWSYAQNAYISTQQQQQKPKPQASFTGAHSKLYKSSEPLLDVTTTTADGGGGGGGGSGVGEQLQSAAAVASSQPHHESSMSISSSSSSNSTNNFHMNTPPTMWHATRANSTQHAGAHFDVTAAKAEETETYIDYRAAALAIGNDINGADIELEPGVIGEGVRAGAATGAGIANVDGYGYGDVDYEMADMAGAAGGAWGGENVALQRTVENIWDITVSLNILYKENWTKLAALEINKFQDQLVKRLVMDLTLSPAMANGGSVDAAIGTTTTALRDAHSRQQQQPFDYHSMEPKTSKHYGNEGHTEGQQQHKQQQQMQHRERYWQLQAARQRQWQLQQQQQQFEWNFATSFLYSLTVVTTVGYGTITPRTTLGRMVTIVYATVGIPLTLVYLSSIGSILAKLAIGFCERLLCCCFCHSSTSKRHTICGFSRQQVSDKKCNLKLQQLQKHHQQQQQHATSTAQQQQTGQQPMQAAHLPYCYVRPPADETLSYGEHSPLSANSTRARAHVLRWSLALPISFCVLLLLAYVCFGSLVIALLEQWSLFDGVYFCFMSLTTIGFCDLLPGVHVRPATTTSTLVVWFCAAYILSGLTLTSMCVNMLHEEFLQRMQVVVKFKKFATAPKERRSFYGVPP